MAPSGSARLPAAHRLFALPLLLACAGAFCLSACATGASGNGNGGGSASARPTAGGTPSAAPAAQTRAMRSLVSLAAQRVMTADTVAAAKWGTNQPIDDPAREKAVMDGVLAQAAKASMNQDIVRRIFEGQMTANKTVQQALYSRWTASPALRPTHRPDLATQVRPVLDRIDAQLLDAIGQAEPLLSGDPRCKAILDQDVAATAATMRLDAVHLAGVKQSLAAACRP